ncbi:Ig-like domain-containing protein [Furfurilactobacillus milii]|uniref:BIG2 domain-containing protein n=1 Tax=Furfurilactobacillus milii TaxID=2888272 RepID=A0A6N9HZ74_9LACO|nr:Ig-like domain-containing protein [Furfurilactobacillus milii]MYV16041.1 hypothetical protein [Furfurilactobacillus milii]
MLKHNGNIDSSVKEHYKMYKAGKKWLFAGIFAAVLSFGGFVSTAQADTANQQPQVVQTKTATTDNTDKVAPTSTVTSQDSTAGSQASSTNTQKSAAPVSAMPAAKSQASLMSTAKSSVSNVTSQTSTFSTNSEAAKSVYVSTSKATKANNNSSAPASQQRANSVAVKTNTTVTSSTTTTASSAPASQARTTATASAPKATSNVSKTDVKTDQPASQANTIELLAEPNSASPVSTTSTSNTSESSTSNASPANSVDTVSDYKPATTDNITNWGISNDWQQNADTWVGNQYNVQAFTNPSDATYHNLSVTSSDPTVATATLDPVTKEIAIKALKSGHTTVQVSLLRNNNKTSIVSFEQSVHTPEKMTSMYFGLPYWENDPGTVQQPDGVYSFGGLVKDTARLSQDEYTLTSSDPTVVSVSGHTLTSLKPGTSVITMFLTDEGQKFSYNSTMTVNKPDVDLFSGVGEAVVPAGYYRNDGLHGKGGLKDGTYNVAYKNETPDIVTDVNGKLTGVEPGQGTIDITVTDKTTGRQILSKAVTVTVEAPKDYYYIHDTRWELNYGDSINNNDGWYANVPKVVTMDLSNLYNVPSNDGTNNYPVPDSTKYNFTGSINPADGKITSLGNNKFSIEFYKTGEITTNWTATNPMGATVTASFEDVVVNISKLADIFQTVLPKDTMALNDEQYVSNYNITNPYTDSDLGWTFNGVTTDTPQYLSVNYSGQSNVQNQTQYLVTALKATPQDGSTFAHLIWNYTDAAGNIQKVVKNVNVIDLIQAKDVVVTNVPRLAYVNTALAPLSVTVEPGDALKYLAPYQWQVVQTNQFGKTVPVVNNGTIYTMSTGSDAHNPVFTFLKPGDFQIQAQVTDKRTIYLGSQTAKIHVVDYAPLKSTQVSADKQIEVNGSFVATVQSIDPVNAHFTNTWTSSDPSVASITFDSNADNGPATITGLKPGTVTITVVSSQEGNNPVTKQFDLKVVKSVPITNVTKISGPLFAFAGTANNYQLIDANGKAVTADAWTSSDPLTSPVNNAGTLFVDKNLSSQKDILLSAELSGKWYIFQVTELKKGDLELEMPMSAGDFSTTVGDVTNFNLSHLTDLSLKELDGEASLTDTGTFTALKAGKVEIHFNSFGTQEVKTITINPAKSINSFSFDYANLTDNTALMGNVLTPTNNFNPVDPGYQSMTWTSSNPDVATVNDQGIVKALLPGTTTITSTVKDVTGKTFTATKSLTVGLNTAGITSMLYSTLDIEKYESQINDYAKALKTIGKSLDQLTGFTTEKNAVPAIINVKAGDGSIVTHDGSFTISSLLQDAVSQLNELANSNPTINKLSFAIGNSADTTIIGGNLVGTGDYNTVTGWTVKGTELKISNQETELTKTQVVNLIEHVILAHNGLIYPADQGNTTNDQMTGATNDNDLLALNLRYILGNSINSSAMGV